jgi:hypothetical protein
MSGERRRAKRVPMSPSFSESDPRTTTPVADLSHTGVLVVHTPVLPLGSRIELCFTVFPEQPLLFRHTGRVVRHSSDPVGMGVELDPLPESAAAIVDEIIERASQQGGRKRKRVVLDAHALRARLLDER